MYDLRYYFLADKSEVKVVGRQITLENKANVV